MYHQNKLKLTTVYNGIWGFKAAGSGFVTPNQLEASRKLILWLTNKTCKVWIKVQCYLPKSKKSIGSRMGKGVGRVAKYICIIKLGTIIFELFFNILIKHCFIKRFLNASAFKLSVPIRIVNKAMHI